MRPSAFLLVALLVWVGGCAAQHAPASRRAPKPGAERRHAAAHEAPPPTPRPASSPTATPAAAVTLPTGSSPPGRHAPPLVRLTDVIHPVTEPVHSLALDPEREKIAALGTGAWLFEQGRWRAIPMAPDLLPAADERDVARIYFGRDHLPRIMGTRIGPEGPRQLYLRYRHGAWRTEQREQAAFAGKPHAALYGVLGWNDPEVLCKVGQFCLIKQRSGWSQVPLPVDPPRTAPRIDLGTGSAYALLDDRLLRLGPKAWHPVGGKGPWKGPPGGAWTDDAGGWVSAPEEGAIYRHDGTAWRRHPSPVDAPRGLWSPDGRQLWVAGQSGAGYFDGRSWYRVGDIAGPLSEVIGLGRTLWFAGESGVWSGRRNGAD